MWILHMFSWITFNRFLINFASYYKVQISLKYLDFSVTVDGFGYCRWNNFTSVFPRVPTCNESLEKLYTLSYMDSHWSHSFLTC